MRALACVFLIACGGGDSGPVEGDPLIQTTLTAEFANKPWTPMFGFARMETSFRLVLGQQEVSCADDFSGKPREGNYASVFIPAPVVGTNSSLLLDLIDVTGGKYTPKIATGTLQITAVNPGDVSAVYSFDTSENGMRYAVNGAVTMLRCP